MIGNLTEQAKVLKIWMGLGLQSKRNSGIQI
jgi:hypothetical protein